MMISLSKPGLIVKFHYCYVVRQAVKLNTAKGNPTLAR